MTPAQPPEPQDGPDRSDRQLSDRAEDLNKRKSHLRSLAVAGTLASVGTFTLLAAAATDTPSTSGQADLLTAPAAGSTNARSGDGLTDDMLQVPSDPWNSTSQDQGSWDGHRIDPNGYFGPSAGEGSQITPPQGSFAGGMAPSMSGGS